MGKRRVVGLIAATGQATLQYEDGTSEHLTFNGGDIELIQATPRGDCQRCGHVHSAHGDWVWDGEDEFWEEHKCSWSDDCPCEAFVQFISWYEKEKQGA